MDESSSSDIIPTRFGQEAFAFEEVDVFKSLPRRDRRQVRLEARLRRDGGVGGLETVIRALPELARNAIVVDHFEVQPRISGRSRSSAVAHITLAGSGEKLAIATETALAHALVDLLLGYDRPRAEYALQLSPTEWGILTFLFAKILERHSDDADQSHPTRMILDRVSADPPETENVGEVSTARWSIRVSGIEGSIRAWLPESVANRLLEFDAPVITEPPTGERAQWSSEWRVEAGLIPLRRGLGALRVGGILPLHDTTLIGPVNSVTGSAKAVSSGTREGRRFFGDLESGASARFIVRSSIEQDSLPREPRVVKPADSPSPRLNPGDLPVTVVVELGRLNIPLGRLADLRPGDVLELGRHSREPVELTSNGRLIARGELVQIDEELGLRVTNVFL